MSSYAFMYEAALGVFSCLFCAGLVVLLLKVERDKKKKVAYNDSPHKITTRTEPSAPLEPIEEKLESKEVDKEDEKLDEKKKADIEKLESILEQYERDKHIGEEFLAKRVIKPKRKPRPLPELSVEERLSLISRNAVDTIGLDEVETKMRNGKTLHGYLGTAPTRSPSIGYFIPLMKFRDLVHADVEMTMFIADLHAFLDKGSRWIDRTIERTAYYIFIIGEILKTLGVDRSEYTFVRGCDVQLDRNYIMDLFKLLTFISDKQAKKAGSEVVKQNKDVMLSSLIYPLMQVIDAVVLCADIEIGGLDQRKIFALGRDHIESIGCDKCAHVMNELLPSLGKPGNKMSSSDLMGKIEFTDTREKIAEKLKKAYCVEKEVKQNPCMDLARLIVFPIKDSLGEFKSYNDLENAWMEGNVYAKQLKDMLTDAIDEIIDPIRKAIAANRILYENAFPPVEPLLIGPGIQDEPTQEPEKPVDVVELKTEPTQEPEKPTEVVEPTQEPEKPTKSEPVVVTIEQINQLAGDLMKKDYTVVLNECDMGDL